MNDIRRTILWVIFGFAMVLLWDKWQVHNGKQATFFPAPATTAAAPAPAATAQPASAASVPAPIAAAPTAAVPGAAAVPAQPGDLAPAAREQVVVTTDVLRLTFDSEGGSLTHAELLKYADMEDKSKNFELLDQSAQRVYVAQTGLIGWQLPHAQDGDDRACPGRATSRRAKTR